MCCYSGSVCVCVFALGAPPHPEGLKEGREGKAQ